MLRIGKHFTVIFDNWKQLSKIIIWYPYIDQYKHTESASNWLIMMCCIFTLDIYRLCLTLIYPSNIETTKIISKEL